MTSEESHVRMLIALAGLPDPVLQREVTDAQWADYGKAVARNIHDVENLAYVLTHGLLKTKNTAELVRVVQAYLLTGAK
jgi:hypothetical protein